MDDSTGRGISDRLRAGDEPASRARLGTDGRSLVLFEEQVGRASRPSERLLQHGRDGRATEFASRFPNR